MTKKFFYCVVFLFITCNVTAQKSYETGYLVLDSNDTLRGFINNKDWKVNPQVISYKSTLSDPPVKYAANQVKYFFLKERSTLYKGVIAVVDKMPVTLAELSKENLIPSTRDTVFLQVLVKGYLSLYYSYDFKNHFFIQKGDGEIQELVLERKLKKDPRPSAGSTDEVLIKIEKYKFLLSSIVSDCGALRDKAQKTEFTNKSLKALIQDYNSCKSSKSDYVEVTKKNKIEVGLVAGGSMTSLDIKGNIVYLADGNYSVSYSPSGGFYLNLVLPRKRESISVYNELLFKSYSVSSTYVKDYPSYSAIYTNHSDFSHLHYNLGCRYRLPLKNIKPFVQGGIMSAFAIKKDAYTDIHYKEGTDITFSRREVHSTKAYEFGAWLGSGVNVKRINLELRLESQEGWSPTFGTKVIILNTYLLFSYRLNY